MQSLIIKVVTWTIYWRIFQISTLKNFSISPMGSHSFQQSTLPSITTRLISIKLEWNFTSIDRNIWPWTILSIIMINEQSGVQFRLKLYAWFENQTSTQHGLKSKVRFQTKSARHEVQLARAFLHPLWNQKCKIQSLKYRIF